LFLCGDPKKWVTTDALSLQYLQTKDWLSDLHSMFVKANKLFFKTKLLKAFSLVDLKLYLFSNPFQLELRSKLCTTWLSWDPNLAILFNQN
jgi:hypothetical protein